MRRKVSKTRQELLDNTINHFNIENRGIKPDCDATVCLYYCYANNKRCAIGIEVNKKTAIALQKENKPVSYTYSFNLLPKRLRNMGRSFLESIQNLHDKSENWTKEGLSLKGKIFVEDIKTTYKLK